MPSKQDFFLDLIQIAEILTQTKLFSKLAKLFRDYILDQILDIWFYVWVIQKLILKVFRKGHFSDNLTRLR